MSKQILSTPDAPAAVGPYAQGWIAGEYVFTAGQCAKGGHTVSETVEGQAEQACRNIGAAL